MLAGGSAGAFVLLAGLLLAIFVVAILSSLVQLGVVATIRPGPASLFFALSVIFTMLSALFCAYGTLLVITQYFQNVRDYSPEGAGLLLLSFSLPSMVFAPIAGRLAARFGGRRPALVGLALVVDRSWLAARYPRTISPETYRNYRNTGETREQTARRNTAAPGITTHSKHPLLYSPRFSICT